MNVIWDSWEEFFHRCRPNSPHATNIFEEKGWNDGYIDCQRIQAVFTWEKWESTARLAYRTAVTIPVQSEALLWAKIPSHTGKAQECALVEPLAEEDGVAVARALEMVKKEDFPLE